MHAGCMFRQVRAREDLAIVGEIYEDRAGLPIEG